MVHQGITYDNPSSLDKIHSLIENRKVTLSTVMRVLNDKLEHGKRILDCISMTEKHADRIKYYVYFLELSTPLKKRWKDTGNGSCLETSDMEKIYIRLLLRDIRVFALQVYKQFYKASYITFGDELEQQLWMLCAFCVIPSDPLYLLHDLLYMERMFMLMAANVCSIVRYIPHASDIIGLST